MHNRAVLPVDMIDKGQDVLRPEPPSKETLAILDRLRNAFIPIGHTNVITVGIQNIRSACLVAEKTCKSQRTSLRRKADRKLTGTKQFEDVKKGVHCTTSKDASKKLGEPRPTTETADYLVTLAGDADMNKAMDTASWNMIELLQKQKGLTHLDAYSLASIAMDCRVGEMEAIENSVHCLV